MNKKELRRSYFSAIIVVVIVVLVILFFVNRQVEEEETIEKFSQEGSFIYVGYSIANQSIMEENCMYIRVGRCDKIGEEFGSQCWYRNVELLYSVDLSTRRVVCQAEEQGIELGLSTFAKAESQDQDALKLTFETDIRKNNVVTVCCNLYDKDSDGLVDETCFDPVTIDAIC